MRIYNNCERVFANDKDVKYIALTESKALIDDISALFFFFLGGGMGFHSV